MTLKTLTKTELSLRLVDSYIQHVRSIYPDLEDGPDNLIVILRIYKLSLRRRMKPSVAKLELLPTLKHGIRMAELLLEDIWENEAQMMAGWYWGIPAKNPAQQLANLLQEIIMTLSLEIMATEAWFPHLKQAFDKEREQYQIMKQEAEEALEQ